MLQGFDYDLGLVDFSVSRRAKITIFTFQLGSHSLCFTEINVKLDETAQKN